VGMAVLPVPVVVVVPVFFVMVARHGGDSTATRLFTRVRGRNSLINSRRASRACVSVARNGDRARVRPLWAACGVPLLGHCTRLNKDSSSESGIFVRRSRPSGKAASGTATMR